MIWRATLVTRVVWRAFRRTHLSHLHTSRFSRLWNKFEVSCLKFVYLMCNASNFWCFGFGSRKRIINSAKVIELRVSNFKNSYLGTVKTGSDKLQHRFPFQKGDVFVVEQPCCLVKNTSLSWKHFRYQLSCFLILDWIIEPSSRGAAK